MPTTRKTRSLTDSMSACFTQTFRSRARSGAHFCKCRDRHRPDMRTDVTMVNRRRSGGHRRKQFWRSCTARETHSRVRGESRHKEMPGTPQGTHATSERATAVRRAGFAAAEGSGCRPFQDCRSAAIGSETFPRRCLQGPAVGEHSGSVRVNGSAALSFSE